MLLRSDTSRFREEMLICFILSLPISISTNWLDMGLGEGKSVMGIEMEGLDAGESPTCYGSSTKPTDFAGGAWNA